MQMDHIHLVLQGYLTPSLNTLLNKHWSHYAREKKLAANALTSALQDILADHSIATTTQEAVNQLLTNYVTLNSSATTRQKTSKSSLNRLKSKPKPKNARKSKSTRLVE